MESVTDGPRGINWQEKYLHQVNARLDGLQQGQRTLDKKVERGFTQIRTGWAKRSIPASHT